ncbi:hypothetical protein ACFL03_07265 [Thermodesulfobacteriota bacterium]
MKKFFNLFIIFLTLLFAVLWLRTTHQQSAESKIFIKYWYGREGQQFGVPGITQPWVNILGNITGDHAIQKCSYSLNSGPVSNIRIDRQNRLADDGDFNIQIYKDNIPAGSNTITVFAEDTDGNKTQKQVSFAYQPNNRWPLPYSINWNTVKKIQSVVQIVDGKWNLSNGGLTNHLSAYDRLFCIGDTSWKNYQVMLVVLPHSSTGLLSIGLRWKGHYQTEDELSPYVGWNNCGASGWYSLHENKLSFQYIKGGKKNKEDTIVEISPREPLWWKLKVETIPGKGYLYSQRMWPVGDEEPDWWLTVLEGPDPKYSSGSIYFLSHMSQVTFGYIEVTGL